MIQKLKIPVYCIVAFALSYYPVNLIGSKGVAEAHEMFESKGDTHCESPCCESCGSEIPRHKGYVSEMIALVKRAKRELLKEKMKANLEAKIGKKLDGVADLFVNAMIDEYKEKYEKMREFKEKHDEYEQRLREIFEGGEGGKSKEKKGQ